MLITRLERLNNVIECSSRCYLINTYMWVIIGLSLPILSYDRGWSEILYVERPISPKDRSFWRSQISRILSVDTIASPNKKC